MKKGVAYIFSSVEQTEKDFGEIKNDGIDYIVLAISEFNLNFYFSGLKRVINIAKQLSLEIFIDLWGFGNAFGGEADSNFLIQNPETTQISNRNKKLQIACFNNLKFLNFIKNSIEKVSQLNPGGLFLDEPDFFNKKEEFSCFCKACKNKFKQKFQKEIPKELNQNLIDFRNDSLSEFISEVSKAAKSHGLKVSICLYPYERDKTLSWSKICRIKEIDIFASDPYWRDPYWASLFKTDTSFILNVGKKLTKICKRYKKESELWVQLFNIPKGKENEIKEAMKNASIVNPDRIIAWCFKAGKDTSLSCDNPDLCWKNYVEALDRIS